jgi:hypothetical protein
MPIESGGVCGLKMSEESRNQKMEVNGGNYNQNIPLNI